MKSGSRADQMTPEFTPAPWQLRETDEGHEIRMGSAVKSYGSYEPQHVINYDHGCLVDDETDEDLSDPSPETRQYFEAKANAQLISASPDFYQAAALLGGGDIYLEEFGRYCFCGACGFGPDKPWRKRFHATACDDMNRAIFKAVGRELPEWKAGK
jgi:hypothetical protein